MQEVIIQTQYSWKTRPVASWIKNLSVIAFNKSNMRISDSININYGMMTLALVLEEVVILHSQILLTLKFHEQKNVCISYIFAPEISI